MSFKFKQVVDQNTEHQEHESRKIPNLTRQDKQKDVKIQTDQSTATPNHMLEKRKHEKLSKLSQLANPRNVKKHKNSPRFVVRGGETEGILWSFYNVYTLCFQEYTLTSSLRAVPYPHTLFPGCTIPSHPLSGVYHTLTSSFRGVPYPHILFPGCTIPSHPLSGLYHTLTSSFRGVPYPHILFPGCTIP